MKDPNGFDELARRKLAERDFTFDQSHWTDMERLLDERDRKPKAWWPWMAAGVLLLGGAVLWSSTSDKTTSFPASNGPVVERIERSTIAADRSATTQVTAPAEAPPAVAGSSQAHIASSGAEAEVSGADTPVEYDPTACRSSPAPPKTTQAPPERVRDGVSTDVSANTADPGKTPAIIATGSPLTTDVPTLHMTGQGDGTSATMNATVIPTGQTTISSEGGGTNNTVAVAAPILIEYPSGKMSAQADQEPSASNKPAPSEPDTTRTERGEQKLDPTVQAPSENTAPEAPEPNPVSAEPSAARTEPPVPSLVEPSAAPPAPPTWLALRTPFELSLLGGAFSTTSDYRGSGTDDWKASTERQNTTGFGIEGVWNIGTHFGLGVGAHYSSYKERLTTSELSRTDEVLSNSYFWVQHDTMVLTVVGDTTIGATTYNITELVPVTINELAIDTDTSFSTTILRERRTVTNTVSYVEIPLLLDAHTSCGRWVFGVRGGPTFGLLTSKQGSIPGEGETDYADLNERTFSSMTLGATARAYARYRLTSAWSIGLEPTWRQQLGNAFGDAVVQRRGNAFGGYLSLSYRFASKSVVP